MLKKYDKVKILNSECEWRIGKIGYIIDIINDTEYVVKLGNNCQEQLTEDCLQYLSEMCYYLIEICSPTPNESYRINKLVVSDTPLTRGQIIAKADCIDQDITKIELLDY